MNSGNGIVKCFADVAPVLAARIKKHVANVDVLTQCLQQFQEFSRKRGNSENKNTLRKFCAFVTVCLKISNQLIDHVGNMMVTLVLFENFLPKYHLPHIIEDQKPVLFTEIFPAFRGNTTPQLIQRIGISDFVI